MLGKAVILTLAVVFCFVGSSSLAGAAPLWVEGAELAIFKHTFAEESWYSTVDHKNEKNETATFGVSFLNMGEIQAFLITLNQVKNETGAVGVLPYQMFGMHYFTKGGKEIFIGALLAFLSVYEDKNNDSVPNVGEKSFYVVPFGGAKLPSDLYAPTVTNMGVKEIGEDHYQMGISYKNMYAIATENPIATVYLATGWVLQFSELTVTYDIKLDRSTGDLTTETFYTIGQISALYAVFLGIPIKAQDIQETLPDNLGLGVVHFTTVFTSNYEVVDDGNTTLDTARDQIVSGIVQINTDDMRAFSVGLRGDFDLIDESTNTTIKDDQQAYNMILKAKPNDLILVAWQLGFSANVFAAMAFGLSAQVRGGFNSLDDLASASSRPLNPGGFGAQAFWYGVFFPQWDGYKVVHDPVYTAYFGEPVAVEDTAENPISGFELPLITVSAALIILITRKIRS